MFQTQRNKNHTLWRGTCAVTWLAWDPMQAFLKQLGGESRCESVLPKNDR